MTRRRGILHGGGTGEKDFAQFRESFPDKIYHSSASSVITKVKTNPLANLIPRKPRPQTQGGRERRGGGSKFSTAHHSTCTVTLHQTPDGEAKDDGWDGGASRTWELGQSRTGLGLSCLAG